MFIGIVNGNENYINIAKGLMDEGYQVLDVSNTNNMKDPEVLKRSMLHKASLCNALIVSPKAEDSFSDAIIQQAVYNSQIVLLDSMDNPDNTVEHVRKEIIHA
jgi:nucleoside-diphosphate-sugar epimerase